jgi:hypothetical protein
MVPTEALAALDEAAEAIERLLDAGIELDFVQPRFSRRLRVLVRDADGRAIAEVGLLDALELLSA